MVRGPQINKEALVEQDLNKKEEQQPKEAINVKRTETKLFYSSEYVTRDELDYHKTDLQKFDGQGLVSEKTLVQKKFHCQHLCHGIKNWGREIFEEPRTKNIELLAFYKKCGYIIVCSECARDCSVCGAPTSTISGKKREGKWHCHTCNKKAEQKEFWQKIINFLGGKWWQKTQ